MLVFRVASSFTPARYTSVWNHNAPIFLASSSETSLASSSSSSATVATLTDQTLWRMRLVMTVPTESGKKVEQLFVITGRFLEESGYEPPQGTFEQELPSPDSATATTTTTTTEGLLRIRQARWQLSEDPNDRKGKKLLLCFFGKIVFQELNLEPWLYLFIYSFPFFIRRTDGLWVWGLFQEPLYPFLLFKMETELTGSGV
jgi:hypothetical protein